MYFDEVAKQEMKILGTASGGSFNYTDSKGEYKWDSETKEVYYKGSNSNFKEFLGTFKF